MRYLVTPATVLILCLSLGCSGSPTTKSSPESRTTFKGHSSPVAAFAFSADGKLLASATDNQDSDNEVLVWDVASGKVESTIRTRRGITEALAFSPDGKRLAAGFLATAGDTDHVRVWDVASREEVASFPAERVAWGVAFSPDGTALAVAEEGVRLWDIASRKERGRFLLAEKRDDADFGQSAVAVAFSPDGKTLTATGYGYFRSTQKYTNVVRRWNAATRQDESTPANPAGTGDSYYPRAMFSADGRTLLLWDKSKGAAVVWDVAGGKKVGGFNVEGDDGVVFALAPHGKALAGWKSGYPAQVHGWEASSGKEVVTLDIPSAGGEVRTTSNAVALSPDGKTLAAGHADGAITLWDVAALAGSSGGGADGPGDTNPGKKDQPTTLRSETVAKVSKAENWQMVLADARTAAVLGKRVTAVDLVDLTNGKGRRVAFGQPEGEIPHDVATSPDGRWLAATSDRGLYVIDVAAGRASPSLGITVPGDLAWHAVRSMAIDNEGRVWGYPSRDPVVLAVYQKDRAPEPFHTFPMGQWAASLRLSPDGKRLYVLATMLRPPEPVQLLVFDTATRKLLRQHDFGAVGISYLPAPDSLAVSADSRTVALYAGYRDIDGHQLPALLVCGAEELDGEAPKPRLVPLPVDYTSAVGVALSADGSRVVAYQHEARGTHTVKREDLGGGRYAALYRVYPLGAGMVGFDLKKMEDGGAANPGAFLSVAGDNLPALRTVAFAADGTIYALTMSDLLRLK